MDLDSVLLGNLDEMLFDLLRLELNELLVGGVGDGDDLHLCGLQIVSDSRKERLDGQLHRRLVVLFLSLRALQSDLSYIRVK